ncbi:DUF2470 domain-containing protein [Thermomonospora umbrina]|uniref:DUF2470 domain-containing protein n=1 Tax=Thermomonospora umbrina TaxID=111806 RepID=A0A3D9SRW9_9ACTN|nr:DUF2470 domain-containing protein [Thermomonospora umbrina]REE98682.1 hypothetical protein DFJ69_4175 [Thermomonospora umbrina]
MKRPTAAERARTLAYGVAGATLVTTAYDHARGGDGEVPAEPVPAHATDGAGRPLLLMPAGSPSVAALHDEPDLPASLRVWDVAPVSLADRLRGQAWLHGWLTALEGEERKEAAVRLSRLHTRPELLDVGRGDEGEWTVLALEVAEVEISDAWGHAVLEPEVYEEAAPDPFVMIEHGMLVHLDACHRRELAGLYRDRFGPVAHDPVVRPLALDRHGLWLRLLAHDPDGSGSFDLYVEFPEPVRDLHGLRDACHRLLATTTP